MTDKRILCESCKKQIGAYTQSEIEIKHRGRIVKIPYSGGDAKITVQCDRCGTVNTLTCEKERRGAENDD